MRDEEAWRYSREGFPSKSDSLSDKSRVGGGELGYLTFFLWFIFLSVWIILTMFPGGLELII